jgi:hypothetical protein
MELNEHLKTLSYLSLKDTLLKILSMAKNVATNNLQNKFCLLMLKLKKFFQA